MIARRDILLFLHYINILIATILVIFLLFSTAWARLAYVELNILDIKLIPIRDKLNLQATFCYFFSYINIHVLITASSDDFVHFLKISKALKEGIRRKLEHFLTFRKISEDF